MDSLPATRASAVLGRYTVSVSPPIEKLTALYPSTLTTDDQLLEALSKISEAASLLESAIGIAFPQSPSSAPCMPASCFRPMDSSQVPFVADVQHRAILDALNGVALNKEALASVTGISAGSLYRKLKPLKKRFLVENQRGVGYFRPDAPPRWYR